MLDMNIAEQIVIGIERIYKHYKLWIIIIMSVIDVLMSIYFAKFIPFISLNDWGIVHEQLWERLYNLVNPFTIGSYVLGVLVLLQFIIFDGTIIKLLLGVFYVSIVFISFVAVIEMISVAELSFLLPHILILTLCVVVSIIKWKVKAVGESSL